MKNDNRCPYCGGEVLIVHSSQIYGNGHDYGPMQVCANYPFKCDAYAGLGATLANAELRGLRKSCHQRFDKMWQSGKTSRKQAYIWLQKVTKKSPKLGHIALFNVKECHLLLSKLAEIGY